MEIRGMIKEYAAKAGIQLRRYNHLTVPHIRLAQELNGRGSKKLLDIGANDGEYAIAMFAAGYDGKILSIEPLADARQALLDKAHLYQMRWEIGPRIAISSENSTAAFHVLSNSVSSSLLIMNEVHTSAAPGSIRKETITVETKRLDDIWDDLGIGSDCFLKLDVQGAELDVLKGAMRILSSYISGLQIEMSVIPLYEGQALWRELDEFISRLGFKIWDLIPGFRDIKSGRLLQFDGVYFKG